MEGTVLIVDDEVGFAKSMAAILRLQGYQTEVAHTAADARKIVAKMQPDVVVMDMVLPDGDGTEVVEELRAKFPDTAFVIATAHGSIRAAVKATQRGALDFLTKPVDSDALCLVLRNVMRGRMQTEEVRRLRSENRDVGPGRRQFDYPSEAMQRALALARHAAAQDGIVLLLGESGTGKDHMARWIHDQSKRADEPFFAINCAALPRELAESELFGHEPGAFTGSRGRKRGLLELANKGTLLLDEVGELDAVLQSKLLTFLDTRQIMRLGGERSIRVEARLIAATNRDLEADVDKGSFRRDLFYRLNVFPIHLPALRDRTEDLPILADEILARLQCDLGLPAKPRIEPDVFDVLSSYHWPGNVRELRNVLERALMLSADGVVRRKHLSVVPADDEWKVIVRFPSGRSLHDVTKEIARKLVLEALRRGQSRQDAARLLGLSRHALAHQIKALGIDK